MLLYIASKFSSLLLPTQQVLKSNIIICSHKSKLSLKAHTFISIFLQTFHATTNMLHITHTFQLISKSDIFSYLSYYIYLYMTKCMTKCMCYIWTLDTLDELPFLYYQQWHLSSAWSWVNCEWTCMHTANVGLVPVASWVGGDKNLLYSYHIYYCCLFVTVFPTFLSLFPKLKCLSGCLYRFCVKLKL